MSPKLRSRTRYNQSWERFPLEVKQMIISSTVSEITSDYMNSKHEAAHSSCFRYMDMRRRLRFLWLALGKAECSVPFNQHHDRLKRLYDRRSRKLKRLLHRVNTTGVWNGCMREISRCADGADVTQEAMSAVARLLEDDE